MPFIERWPGHDAMIASILKNPRARRTPLDEIEAMDKPTLQRFAQLMRENPMPHHAPGTRDPLPVQPAAPALKPLPVDKLPAWAQDIARRSPTRVAVAPENRPPRYKAQVWHNGYSVHLGTFDTIEARDAAVQAAKDRRAIGLPLKG